MSFNCRKHHFKLYQSKFILLHGYNMQHYSSLWIRQYSWCIIVIPFKWHSFLTLIKPNVSFDQSVTWKARVSLAKWPVSLENPTVSLDKPAVSLEKQTLSLEKWAVSLDKQAVCGVFKWHSWLFRWHSWHFKWHLVSWLEKTNCVTW